MNFTVQGFLIWTIIIYLIGNFVGWIAKCNAMTQLQSEIHEWQEKTFPNADAFSKYHHLVKEVIELGKALYANVGVRGELADCQHLLFGIASKRGFNQYEITREKFGVNKNRKWGKPDEHGVVEHIAE